MNKIFAVVLMAGVALAATKTRKTADSAYEKYMREVGAHGEAASQASPGSLWSDAARFSDMARDHRASQRDDVITILVSEQASAVAKGDLKTSRSSSAKASIGALGGVTRAAGPWANLAKLESDRQLAGEGSTGRSTVVSTTMAARVVQVLPNGLLAVEAEKDVQVNGEHQTVTVRGIVRPADVGPGNVVRSDHIAQMELRVNGKGVIGDAVKRPFFLYRLLLGLLPF